MREDWLTLPDLVRRAVEVGLEVSDRTVRFYVSKGLLAPPVRAPFPGADGRVSWFPADSLRRLRRISHLKAQGLSLEQIARVLAHRGGESLKRLSEGDGGAREVAFRYLQSRHGEEVRQARLEFLAAVTGTEREDLLFRASRRYLARRLALLVGEEEASRAVDEWLHGLSPAELQRRLEPFRQWRDGAREEAPSPAGRLRRLAGDRLLNLIDAREFEARLQGLLDALGQVVLPGPPPPGAVDLQEPAVRALEGLREGLGALKAAGSEEPDAGAMARALDRFQQGESLLLAVREAARRHAEILDLT